MIDKGLYKTRVGLRKGTDRQSYSASQTTSGRSKRNAPSTPRSSPFSGNESRQQYSAIQTATGAVKGGGSKRPGRKDYSTRFVSGDEGRDSRDAFIRAQGPDYTGGSRFDREPSRIKQFLGGLFSLLPGMNILKGLSGLNQKLRNTDFGRSKNLMDYLDMKKFGGYDEREMARRINLDEAKLLQDRIDAGEFGGVGSLDFGDTTVPRSSYDMAGVLTPFAQPAPEQFVSKFLPDTDIFNQQTTSYQKRPEEVETDIFFRPQIKPEEGGILDLEIPGFTVEDKYVDALTFPTDDGSGISLMNRSILRNAGYNDSQIKEAFDKGYGEQLIRDVQGPIGGSAFG